MALFRRPVDDDRPWREASYVALDFETTTADVRLAVPLSVGWVGVRDGLVQCGEAGYTLVRPSVAVPEDSVRIHGLLPEHLDDGPSADEVAAQLRTVLQGAVLVAHHAALERAVLERLGVPVIASVDTLAVLRRLDERDGQGAADPRLPEAARRHGIPALPAHHAFRDALTTALLLLALADRVEARRGACTVADLMLLSRS